MPSIRSLETLHNALSLKQLDAFLHYISTTAFKTPCPSPARTSSPTYRGPQMSRQSSEYISKLANCMLDVQNNFAMYKITDCFSPIFDFFCTNFTSDSKIDFWCENSNIMSTGNMYKKCIKCFFSCSAPFFLLFLSLDFGPFLTEPC